MILIAIFSILFLVVLHELGHFLIARKFGVRVEEFGIGLPPRVFGKKIGETMYSLNALPLGAFVRMTGEDERSDDPRSFSKQPVFRRMLIVAGGVIVFWLVAAFLFAGIGATTGIPSSVNDTDLVPNANVQILGVAKESPAEIAGLKPGDIILNFNKVGDIQKASQEFKGKDMLLSIKRGKEMFDVALVPRVDPPAGQGVLGVSLARTALIKYIWYEAPLKGAHIAWSMTTQVIQGLWNTLTSLAGKHGLPEGVELTGPVGIVVLLKNALSLGVSSFLFFVAVLSIYLAVFNILPIPAADGGRLVFLLIEAIRKKPVPEALEKRIISVSFALLIIFFLFITFRDVKGLL